MIMQSSSRRALLLMAGMLFALRVSAAPSALAIERLEGNGWRAEGLSLTVELAAAGGPQVVLTVDRVALTAPGLELRALSVRCPGVALNAREIRCAQADYRFRIGQSARSGRARVHYRARDRRLEIAVPAFQLEAGPLALSVVVDAGTMQLTARARALALPALSDTLARWLPAVSALEIAAGTLDLDLTLDLGAEPRARGILEIADLAFNDTSGRLAGEALRTHIDIDAIRAAADPAWRGDLSVAIDHGGAYAEPVYLDLGRYPLRMETDFALRPDTGELTLEHFELIQAGTVTLTGSAHSTREHRLDHVILEVQHAEFPATYDAYFAGALVGTPLASLDTHGTISGRAELSAGRPIGIEVGLDDLHVEDRAGRFAFYGVNGEVHWAAIAGDIGGSRLEFGGGYLFGAGFDATTFELGIAGQAVDLLEPARVPLLGGALVIKSFRLRDYGSDDLALGFEAELEPIELGQLTTALEWPVFSGTLSGRLPLLTYKKGVVTLGGALEAHAFDGDISVENLRIEQPFGIVPRINLSLRMRNLDLGQVTEVVPFGQVEGRLDGDIDGLRLLKGEPVAFDAYFRTPENDESRHRMSQRAVDTISRVAGGGAVLSTTFLRIFKHFAYDRLGISCRLENDICHMGGVGDTDDGYYIVKGALIPRVDLIGRVRRVKWSQLMQQLEQALNEGEFKIE